MTIDTVNTTLTDALKEWQVAVNALEEGKTILLLRKGGIKEQGGRFSVKNRQVLLYPTYEHQKPQLLKPHYQAQVQTVPSSWHPETIRIGSWANITAIIAITSDKSLAPLFSLHIWNEQFVEERLKWKPHQPLYLLLLRVYRLPNPIFIPYLPAYAGCQSWIELDSPVDITKSVPVLNENQYQAQVNYSNSHIDEVQSLWFLAMGNGQ